MEFVQSFNCHLKTLKSFTQLSILLEVSISQATKETPDHVWVFQNKLSKDLIYNDFSEITKGDW